MLKRVFTGVIGLAVAVMVAGVLGDQMAGRVIAAGTPPPGCFSDSSGLIVCGPNYAGPGGAPTPFPTPSPISSSTAGPPSAKWTTGPGSAPQLSILFPTGGGGGGSVTYGAGVPATAASPGQIYSATDAGLAGMRLFSYDGAFTGLPYVDNRGLFVNASATAEPTIPMERAVAANDLLVAMLTGAAGGFTYASPEPGWTQLFKNESGNIGVWAAYKVSTGGETSESPVALSNMSNQTIVIASIANASPNPVPTSTTGTSSYISMTSVSTNALLLLFSGCPTGGTFPISPQGSNPDAIALAGVSNAGSSNGTAVFTALPFIAPYVGASTGWNYEACQGGAIIQVPPSSTVANFWDVLK